MSICHIEHGLCPQARSYLGLRASLIAVAAVLVLAGPASAASTLYTVAKLHVDVTAKNAVEAKHRALAEAERRAARILFKRLAPFNTSDRLPRINKGLIEDLLEGFSVRSERNSRTRYLATLDFNFRKHVVDQLLTGYGIPVTDQQAPEVTLLPIFIANGRVDRSGRDPWRKAWRRLDLANAVAPVRLAQVKPKVTIEFVGAISRGDGAAYTDLLGQYKTQQLILAIATQQSDGLLVTRLLGADQAGTVGFQRQDRIRGHTVRPVAERAAEITLGILEGRWKMARAKVNGASAESRLTPVSLVVEFSGLRDWQAIRSRLAAVPGVQALSVTSLSARSAGVALQYPGGAERLGNVVGSHRLLLENQGGAWVLRAN